MKYIMECVFGSHLYGLSLPTSDYDYKGIILPTKQEILLGKAKYHIDHSTNVKSKNTKDDIDRTFYSLQYFVELAKNGETVCLDMLAATDDKLVKNSEVWQFLRTNRQKFYTKNMKSFIGYCRKQSMKYSIKGIRITECEKILNFLKEQPKDVLVGDLEFPETEFGKWIEYKGNQYYEFAGSKYQDNLRISFMIDTLQKTYDKYGERAKEAQTNIGVDWKAIGCACRAAYSLRDIYKDGDFSYPLKETDWLMKVRRGELDFLTEVEPELDRIIKEVYVLSEKSTFPEKVDHKFWDDFVSEVHLNIVNDKQFI
jgi:hypothetical protein